MNITVANLPDYEHPPLSETVFSLNFTPVEQLTNAHLGIFWNSIRNEFPEVRQLPVIDPSLELFDAGPNWQPDSLQLQLGPDPRCRLQLRDPGGSKLLQVQNDRITYNWLRVGDKDYPRYSLINESFNHYREAYGNFIENEFSTTASPLQWELVYVNHIHQNDLWNSPADWHNVLPSLYGNLADASIGEPELANSHYTFRFHKPNARLHVETSMVHKNSQPDRSILRLQLTARGPVEDADTIDDRFEIGHKMIVQTFRKMASDRANKFWGLK